MKHTIQSAVGTSFHDTVINTTVNKLRKHLGKPGVDDNDGEDKINYCWTMETRSGDVFTVYDWKEYRPLLDDEEIEWHIGGKNRAVTELALLEIEAAFESNPEIEDDRMKVVNKETYKTTIFTVDYGSDTYTVTHSESFDDVFTFEWHIDDGYNDEITAASHPTLYENLIELVSQYL
jgi:hypothetical protein